MSNLSPAEQLSIVTNIKWLPNGSHTLNPEQWFSVWFNEARVTLERGELQDLSPEDLEFADTQEEVDAILQRVYDMRVKRIMN